MIAPPNYPTVPMIPAQGMIKAPSFPTDTWYSQTYRVLEDFTVDEGSCTKWGPYKNSGGGGFLSGGGGFLGGISYLNFSPAGIWNPRECLVRNEKLIGFKAGDIISTRGSSGPDKWNPGTIQIPWQGGKVTLSLYPNRNKNAIDYKSKLQLLNVTTHSKSEWMAITNTLPIVSDTTIDNRVTTPNPVPPVPVPVVVPTPETPPVAVINTTKTTKTAGVGDNKMLIWLLGGGLVLWYLNKEGYLKKILK